MADLNAIRKKLDAVKAARDSATQKAAENVRTSAADTRKTADESRKRISTTAGSAVRDLTDSAGQLARQSRTYTRQDGGAYSDRDLTYRYTPPAGDPQQYTGRRQSLVKDTLQAGQDALARTQDTGSVQNVGSLYRELLALAAASRERSGDAAAWEQESAGIGNDVAAEWYASAARTTGAQPDQLDKAASGLVTGERNKSELERLAGLGKRERDIAAALYQGSGARQLSGAEQQSAAAATSSDIDEAEAELARMQSELDAARQSGDRQKASQLEDDIYYQEFYIETLKNAEGQLAGDKPVTVYENDYDALQQDMQTTRADYLQTRQNIDFIEGEIEKKRARAEQDDLVSGIAKSMQRDGVTAEDYNADYLQMQLEQKNKSDLKRLFTDDTKENYTAEEYAMLRYAQENYPASAAALEELLDTRADARANTNVEKMLTDPERSDIFDNPAGNMAMALAGALISTINAVDVGLQELDQASGGRRFVNYERTALGNSISKGAREKETSELASYGSLNDFAGRVLGSDVNIPYVGDMTLADLWNAGTDGLISISNGLLFGHATGLATSLQAGDSAMHDQIDTGVDYDTARKYGIAAGVNEGLGEQLGFESFIGFGEKLGLFDSTKGRILLGLVLQPLNEGVQEGATEYLNIKAEDYVLGYQSDVAQAERAYLAEGYDYDTALELSQEYARERIVDSAIQGVLGGLIRSGGGYIERAPGWAAESRRHNANVGGRILENNNAAAMANRISEFTGKTVRAAKTSRQATRQYEKFMEAAGSQISETMRSEDDRAVVEYYRKLRTQFMESAGAAQTEASGETKKRRAARKSEQNETLKEGYLEGLLKKAAAGGTLNKQEAFAVERSDAARGTLEAINNGTLSADRTESEKQIKLANEIANAIAGPIDGTSEGTRAKAQSRAEGMKVSDEGASVGGEQVRVNGITQVAGENGDARVTVTMPDGSAREVNMSEVTFARESAELYSYAADMASREVANAFRTLYTRDQDMARVATGMNAAYDMGRAGYRNIETVRKSVLTSELTDQQLTRAYELGAGARTAEQNRIITAAAFRAREAMGRQWRGGQVTYDNVNIEALSAEQRRDAELAAVIAGLAGKNVELFESLADESGRYVGENGSYNPKTNTIRIDVNAGRNSRRDSMALTALMKTMSHELTHDIQKNAPKEYAILRDAVLDVLESQENVDLNDLVDAKLARDGRLSREAALDEVVADACEDMLRDSDFAQRMQQAHPEAARTLGQRLRELLGRIVDAIKAAYQGGRLSREASMLMREAERYRQIADMWAEGALKAAEVTGRLQTEESTREAAESESEGAEATAEGAEAAPGQELAGEYDEPAQPAEAHIDNRTWESVAEKSVEPFQNDYRIARSYMGVAAKTLLQDANESVPGKRFMNAEGEWRGQKRITTPVLAELMDKGGWSWDRLKSGLTKISDAFDAGDLENKLPNNVLIKRLELVLDEMLTDGYTTLDGTRINPDTGYLAYKAALPGAAKQATPEAAADGVDFGEYVQFSMRNPVEQTGTLIAVHNITEEKLEKALKLGGLPMPSIAITKTDIGHQNYGGISLVFGKSTIDPQADRRNKTYSADAWTPTFPRTEYEVDKNADARIYNKLSGIEGRLAKFFAKELSKIKYETENMLNSYGGEEGLIQKALSNYGLKAAYLEENGGHAEVVRRQEEQKSGNSEEQAQKYAAIVELIGEEALKKTPISELYDKYGGQVEAIWPGATKMRRLFMRLLQNAANYADIRNQAPRTVTVTDEAATRKALDDRIDAAEYESWVRELYSGIVKASGVYNGKELFTSTGNRRSFSSTHYPETVEGIARAMHDAYGGKTKNVSNMYNAKTLRAVTSKTFKSIDEMHRNEGRLRARTQEKADALTSELNKRLNTLTARILSDKNGGKELSLYDQMTSQDQISAILHETAAKKYSASTIKNGLAGYGYEISDATARELKALFDDISEMPVNIFEAKPERAVYFDEVEYAIVPDDMSSAVRSELDKVVADVREYPAGDEARRLELLNARDDVKFSERSTEQISVRELLANVMEDASTSADEMAWLKGYRKDLKELDRKLDAISQNKQIIRELMFKKGRTSEESQRLSKARERLKILNEQVARMDEGLLKLEGSDFIRGLVEREAQKIRDKEAEKRRAGIAKVRETQRNAAVRKNIRQRAKRLDRMLREPTDRDHIPEGLKSAMIDLMDIFTRNDDSAFGATAKDRERLYRAQSEYMAMQSADPESDIASRYDEDTADRLRQLGNLMNDGKLTEFGAAELAEVSKVLEHFEHLIRDQNDEFRESKRKKTEEYAREIWQQTGTMKGRKENAFTAHALVKSIKHMGQANITPVYFYKHLGGAMGKLGNDLLKAEGRYGVNAGRAEARIEQIKEAHGYKSWAAKKGDILRLETESGEALELTREQALGIWASAKRERTNTIQRAEHLRTGGVILEKAARKAGLKGQELNLTPTKISDNDIAVIDGWLTDQQKKYADAMVNYISTDMAELGNETSMELVGYKKFGEGYYYPYKTSSDFRRTNLGNVEQALIKNMGFTKATVRNAKTPVVITDFSQTVADHVNAMLMYNAFAAPQDQLLRVYDFKLDDSTSVKNMLRSAYGDEVPGYIEQQMRDLYGGVSPDRDAGLVNTLISGHKRAAVLGSASVVIQQPTAIIRAMSEVNLKYFAGKLPAGGFEEAKQYAGTAVIKDMGGFDTSMSRGATDWINGNTKDWQSHPVRSTVDKINDVAGMGAEKADQLAWSLLWKAVKKEQAEKTGLDINSEELKQRAGDRFDEVVRLTQVYDSVMSKSQLMRNKNVFWKGATAFMAEPTVTMNMMLDMVFEARKGNKKKAGGIFASVLVSIIFTNLAKALVTAGRDDDDEEATWLERYVKNVTDGLINDLIPFNYVPIARDVYSKLQGYDVERTDMSIINDILAAGETILNPDSSPYKRAKSGVQVLSLITKIPAHNLWREVEATINTVTATPPWKAREGWLENAMRTGLVEATPIGKWFDLNDSKSRSTDKLYEALMDGDAESAGEWRSHLMLYNGAEDDAAVNSLLRSRIKEGYENGEMDSTRAVDMLTEHTGMKRYDAEKRVAEWSYAVDTGTSYSDLKDEYLNGNLTDEEAIAARVEYGGADETDAADTIAKWRYEKENGIAYADMKDAYIAGDLTEAQAIADMAEYGGVREADARQTVSEWNYEKESGGEWGQMKADYIAGRMTADEVVSAQVKYGGALENDVRAQLLKWDYERDSGIAYTDMKSAYLEGGISREAAVEARVKYGGLDADAAEQEVSKWDFEADYGYSYDDMRDYYELGNISYDEAVAARVKYGGAQEDDAYFAVAGWEYEQETGGEWDGKFTKIHDAVDSGSSADMRSSIQEVYDHSAYDDGKKAASAVTSNITSTYKPIYLAATPAQRAAMEPKLLEAYRLAYELAGEVYYGDSYKLKQIRKWAED